MSDNQSTAAWGIVFVGPPGQFTIWTQTPHGFVMDRKAVELLGQMASLAGAADYRVFELESPRENLRFATPAQIETYADLIRASSGLPASSESMAEELC